MPRIEPQAPLRLLKTLFVIIGLIFTAQAHAGLPKVSERFKVATEAAGLMGMVFTQVWVYGAAGTA